MWNYAGLFCNLLAAQNAANIPKPLFYTSLLNHCEIPYEILTQPLLHMVQHSMGCIIPSYSPLSFSPFCARELGAIIIIMKYILQLNSND